MAIPTHKAILIFQFLGGKKDIKDLEEWVYSDDCLETYFNDGEYITLISLDFQKPSAPYLVEKILNEHIEVSDYIVWKLNNLMEQIITRTNDVHHPILETYHLYCAGYGFLRKLAMGFGLVVASCGPNHEGWDTIPNDEQKSLINGFYPEIIDHAKRVQSCLNQNNIEFTKLEPCNLLEELPYNPSYLDHRNAKEKRLMTDNMVTIPT